MRTATVERNTKETQIRLALNLDGDGKLSGTVPIAFFHHMLDHVARYSLFDIEIEAKGDIEIDGHHTVEDIGIVFGEAIRQALGDKKGIFRYGQRTLPMDETLVTVSIDFSGRPYFQYTGPDMADMGKLGEYDAELTPEFLHKLSIHAQMNLHVLVHYGANRHHIHEAIFKALGFALREGASLDPRRKDIPSTKGVL